MRTAWRKSRQRVSAATVSARNADILLTTPDCAATQSLLRLVRECGAIPRGFLRAWDYRLSRSFFGLRRPACGNPARRRSTIGRSKRWARCRRTATFRRERCSRRATSSGERSSMSRSRTTPRNASGSSSITSSSTRVNSRAYAAASGDAAAASGRARRPRAADSLSAASSGRSRRSAITPCNASWRTMAATQEHAGGPPWYCLSFCRTMIPTRPHPSRASPHDHRCCNFQRKCGRTRERLVQAREHDQNVIKMIVFQHTAITSAVSTRAWMAPTCSRSSSRSMPASPDWERRSASLRR